LSRAGVPDEVGEAPVERTVQSYAIWASRVQRALFGGRVRAEEGWEVATGLFPAHHLEGVGQMANRKFLLPCKKYVPRANREL
jgi:hypothetical protein